MAAPALLWGQAGAVPTCHHASNPLHPPENSLYLQNPTDAGLPHFSLLSVPCFPPCYSSIRCHRAHLTASARGLSTKQDQAPDGAEKDLLHGESSRTRFACWLGRYRALRTPRAPGRKIPAALSDKNCRNLSPGHSYSKPFGSPVLWVPHGSASELRAGAALGLDAKQKSPAEQELWLLGRVEAVFT